MPSRDNQTQLVEYLLSVSNPNSGPFMNGSDTINVYLSFKIYHLLAVVCLWARWWVAHDCYRTCNMKQSR
jgi:hypothetical protein